MIQLKSGIFRIATLLIVASVAVGQEPTSFGGEYAALVPAQQRLIADWVARFNEVTGQDAQVGAFYDDLVKLSSKTTFDAVTHALMTSTLTDDSEVALGTALDVVETLETVKGKIRDASGDRQFRMYVILKPGAVETLDKSREFQRGADNTIFHKGYPTNYRQQGGVPSIQISIARDGRRADIDVDYRASSFPAALFNGHLSASNSDVRAGNNDDRHNGRWAGLPSWWQGLFGIRLRNADYDDVVKNDVIQIPTQPRIGDQTIEKMTYDFLQAWLIEGNAVESMGYISEQAYPCVAMDQGSELDLGMAPFILMMGMKEAHEALGQPETLEGVTSGVRLSNPALKLVRQPHHAQFVLYSVPDDIARDFDCVSRLKLAEDARRAPREYGNYFGSVFFVNTPEGRGETVALLWAREGGSWKIVSYELEPMEEDPMAELYEPPETVVTTIDVDEVFADVVEEFLTDWFIRNDYDAAFQRVSPKSYSCYNLYRDESAPEASSPAEAASYIRSGFERSGEVVGARTNLESLIASIEPSHPIVRVMSHPASDTYSLISVPNAIAEWADCSTRARDVALPDDLPTVYGGTYGANFRFRTQSGEAPVFRTLWVKEDGEWKIISYDIEDP